MKLQKLLAGAAAAALISTQASGFVVTFGDANGDASTGDLVTAVAVAEEASFAALNSDTGLLELTITTDLGGTFAEDENYIVNVDIAGGTFSRNVLGSDLTDGVAMVGGTTIGFDGADRTGETGETNVEFLTNIAMPGNSIGVELPIRYADDCNDLTVTVTIEVGTGQSSIPLEQGTFPSVGGAPFVAITCVNAFKALVTADTDFPYVQSNAFFGNDSFLTSASEFERFREDVTTADSLVMPTLDTPSRATLGVASVEFNPTGTTRPILTDLRDGSDALDGSESVELRFAVVLRESETGPVLTSSGVESATVEGGTTGQPFTGGSANLIVPVDASAPNEALVAVDLPAWPGPVDDQDVFANNVNLELDTSEGLDAFDTDEMGMELDDINFEGVRCGEFDWVHDSTSDVSTMIRATGYGSNVIGVMAQARNRTNAAGTLANGMITGLDFSGADVIITDDHITDALGNFGTADITLNFIGANGPATPPVGTVGPNDSVGGLDCDRLMMTPGDAHMTPFGNAATGQNFAVEGYVNDGDDNIGIGYRVITIPTTP